MVNRKRYEEWERAVVHEFWDPAKARTKAKVLVVCDSLGDYKTKAASYATMYHIGKGCPDRVKVGTENGTVFYPATDTGGLTNYKVKEGERPRFEGKALRPEDGANVYREWKRLSGKRRFYGGVADRLEKWLASCPAGSSIRFHRLPDEKRVVVPAERVKKKVGKYFLRVFGKGNDLFAEQPANVRGMYASVSATFVTPNVNRNNVLNEYGAWKHSA